MSRSSTWKALWLRYHGVTVAAVALAVALVGIDLILGAAYGSPPVRLIGRYVPPSVTYDYEAAERASGLIHAGQADASYTENFGVIIGASSARQGINPTVLEAADGLDMRWSMFTSVGGNCKNLERVSRALGGDAPAPAVVILAAHPTFLIGTPVDQLSGRKFAGSAFKHFLRGSIRRGLNTMTHRLWFVQNGDYIRARWLQAEFDTRLTLAQNLGEVDTVFQPNEDPWTSPERIDMPRGKKILDQQLRKWLEFGWFVPESYRADHELADVCRGMIDDFVARGSRVYILLCPYHTTLRTQVPPRAYEVFAEVCQGGRPAGQVTIIDLESSMPDEAFADFSHLNAEGQQQFSVLLGKVLGETIRAAEAGR